MMKNLSLLALALFSLLPACGSGSSGGGAESGAGATGTITIRLSDPPVCKVPNGDLQSVWVTVTKVRAHLDENAGSGKKGWVDILDLEDAPVQINLLDLPATDCVLTTLGSTTGLPPGDYQQIRLFLLSNSPAPSAKLPSSNLCNGTGSYNCLESNVDGLQSLELSSQDKSGLKIPPGQIVGGKISLKDGEAADLNIDFDACRSILKTGNGSYKLKPTLTAGVVALQRDVIQGRVVDSSSGTPISGGEIIVSAQKADSTGIHRILLQTMADPVLGTFQLCPLPDASYDIVAAGYDGNGDSYHATVTFGVPVGEDIGDLPLQVVAGRGNAQATLEGLVTTTDTGANPTSSDIEMIPLQKATSGGGSTILFSMPSFGTNLFRTEDNGCPPGTKCYSYSQEISSGNPMVGDYLQSGTIYTPPLGGQVFYSLQSRAFIPDSGGLENCSPAFLFTDQDSGGNPLEVFPGLATTAAQLDFSECQPGN